MFLTHCTFSQWVNFWAKVSICCKKISFYYYFWNWQDSANKNFQLFKILTAALFMLLFVFQMKLLPSGLITILMPLFLKSFSFFAFSEKIRALTPKTKVSEGKPSIWKIKGKCNRNILIPFLGWMSHSDNPFYNIFHLHWSKNAFTSPFLGEHLIFQPHINLNLHSMDPQKLITWST